MKQLTYYIALALLVILMITIAFDTVGAQTRELSGKIKTPEDECNAADGAECSEAGKLYTTYARSPRVSKRTKAILTINSFEKGGDGGGPAECDNKYHSNKKLLVALSTGWFNNKKRCHKYITISGNGRSVKAMVVDECDSRAGCRNNIVDASEAVWRALGVPKKDWGTMKIFWSDA